MATDPVPPDWHSHGLTVRGNLERVLAGAPPAVIERKVGETFANFGAFFADLLTLDRRPGADLRAHVASARGAEHLDTALAAGRGVVLLTARLGNWELAGRLLSSRGGRTAHVVLSAEQDAALERVIRAHPTQWFNFFDAWSPPNGRP